MAWGTTAQVTTRLFRILADNNQDTDSVDTTIISDSTTDAQNAITQVLRERGYTVAQISTWARQKEYHIDYSVYLSAVRMGFRRNDKQRWIEDLNRLDELADPMQLFEDDGDLITPGDTPALSTVGVVDLESENTDLGIDY